MAGVGAVGKSRLDAPGMTLRVPRIVPSLPIFGVDGKESEGPDSHGVEGRGWRVGE